MAVRELNVGDRLEVARGDTVVCVPLYGGHEHFAQCLSSLLRHTDPTVPLLIADDCTPDPASRALVERLEASGELGGRLTWLARPSNVGFVENVNGAFATAAPADVVIVNSDVEVAAEWLEGLRAAACSDTTIGTATPLTNHGTIVSVPHRNTPQPALPEGHTLDSAAALIREASPRLRPRVPVGVGHCLYVRRAALDLVGDFDEAFSPGYGEEVDFAQRCLRMGLQHVVADDVLVSHHGSGSFGAFAHRSQIQDLHEQMVNERYPYYPGMVQAAAADELSPLARALGVASRELLTTRVTVDGRALGGAVTGTQIHVLELVAALDRTGDARIRVLVPDVLGPEAEAALTSLPEVRRITVAEAAADGVERDDVVHRPWQVATMHDASLLLRLGERVVLTQQDLIAYRNPSYFENAGAWLEYRRLAFEVLAISACTLFFSQHTRDETVNEELVEPNRARVVRLGVDHRVTASSVTPRCPAAMHGNAPFLLCLGTDFLHKNRVFALRLLEALRRRHGWAGRLVLAGPTVASGSSASEEARFLEQNPAVRAATIGMGSVDDAEKAWLLRNCAAVVYPSTYEGFGLMPFESAEAGAPCIFAHQSSLAELFDERDALIVRWDADATADAVIGLLTDLEARAAQVERIRAVGRTLRWDDTGRALHAAYQEAMRMPAPPAARIVREPVNDDRYWGLRNGIGGTGMSLVDPDGPLLPADAQRSLAALARRRATRWAVVGPLAGASRLGARVRALRGRDGAR